MGHGHAHQLTSTDGRIAWSVETLEDAPLAQATTIEDAVPVRLEGGSPVKTAETTLRGAPHPMDMDERTQGGRTKDIVGEIDHAHPTYGIETIAEETEVAIAV